MGNWKVSKLNGVHEWPCNTKYIFFFLCLNSFNIYIGVLDCVAMKVEDLDTAQFRWVYLFLSFDQEKIL